MNLLIVVTISTLFVHKSECSLGDHSPYYQRCVEKCGLVNCTDGRKKLGYVIQYEKFGCRRATFHWLCTAFLLGTVAVVVRRRVPLWMHVENCRCLSWSKMENPTVLWKGGHCAFVIIQTKVMFQWPFVRFFGIQEPASAFFSVLNFYAHSAMITKFRREVPSDSPLYWLWHSYCIVI